MRVKQYYAQRYYPLSLDEKEQWCRDQHYTEKGYAGSYRKITQTLIAEGKLESVPIKWEHDKLIIERMYDEIKKIEKHVFVTRLDPHGGTWPPC